MRERGYVLYPGKLTQVDTLRVGCIGNVEEQTMRRAVAYRKFKRPFARRAMVSPGRKSGNRVVSGKNLPASAVCRDAVCCALFRPSPVRPATGSSI